MSSPRAIPAAVNGWSAEYLDAQYRLYLADPGSVPGDLLGFFRGFELAMAGELRLGSGVAGRVPPSNGSVVAAGSRAGAGGSGGVPERAAAVPAAVVRLTTRAHRPAGQASHAEAIVDDLVDAYRQYGHLTASTDPFGRVRERPEMLTLGYHGLGEQDLGQRVDGSAIGLGSDVPLSSVVERLEQTYCGSVGAEVMHIQDAEQRLWLIERIESSGARVELDRKMRAHLLEQLVQAESFEKFLGKRYPGDKRFSLEGSEALIPLLDQLIETSSGLGVEEIVLGMAHRGRLNVLNNTLGKSYEQIFTEFEETWMEDFVDGGGDVKYHRGYSSTRMFNNGRMVHLSLASNPSHLESVDPVVLGRCRAKQRLRGDRERRRVIPVVIHGDAAVAGQGIVFECINMSQLEGYTVGGCIHVVVNNQIGFTTVPEDARSTRYCTDVGKAIDAPILHVNGEDAEAVVACARIAMEYRQRFRRDVFIDMQCFRRYGHNEQDEMSFTQPLLAKLIKDKPGVLEVYSRQLEAEGVINAADLQAIQHRLQEALEKAQKAAREKPNDPTIDPGSARWQSIGVSGNEWSFDTGDTGVPIETLIEVSEALGRLEDGFTPNAKLKRLLEERRTITEGWLDPDTEDRVSYAEAESLAIGTLLLEGHPVRISGQDSRRGTFSHRHAVLRDAETGKPYTPLNHIREVYDPDGEDDPREMIRRDPARQARLCVYDSPLSEASVLGFDYGYSLADPQMLVCWEAQFGDFANGAQVIFDQFICSAEGKWGRWSGLVVLLPHGYEGQGPEHSSARMERFLKLCGNNNIQVVYPTTGAQCFHMLRRQLKRSFRKPLIVMTPKSLLRRPTSRVEHLVNGNFQEIIDDPAFNREGGERSRVRRVLLVCGKLYYELDERRRASGRDDVAIVRIEQVYPFHTELFREVLSRYPAEAELVYAQEEPRNMAAYLFVSDIIMSQMGRDRPRYIGRPASGSPATGSKKQHKYEQERILTEAVAPPPAQEPVAGSGQQQLASAAH